MTDPDAPPVFDRRTTRRLWRVTLVLAAGLAVMAAVVGSRAVRRAADEHDAKKLFHLVRGNGVVPARPLTDPEFEQAVALLDSPARMARNVAAQSAGESADPPARRARLADIARRQLAGTDADDRHTGLLLVSVLKLVEFREQADTLWADPDPGVREIVGAAVSHLTIALPEDRP